MTVQARRSNLSVLEESATTSDPSLRGVFNEDAVSIVGDVVALLGLAISQLIGSSVPQAIAAVLIALVLIRISLRLVKRNHDFLLGQPIPAPDQARVRTFLLDYPGVTAIRELLVTFVGPGQVWVLTCIEIDKNLSSHDITDVVCGIDLSLRHESKFIYRVDVVPVSKYG